jgi:hypothetical protein
LVHVHLVLLLLLHILLRVLVALSATLLVSAATAFGLIDI